MALRFIDKRDSAKDPWEEWVRQISGIRDREQPKWAHKGGMRWNMDAGWSPSLQGWSQGNGWRPTEPRMIDLSAASSID